MENKQSVDREAVKVLAIAVGVREAARRLGLNEERVMKWSQRDQWLKQPDPVPLPPTVTKNQVRTVRKPSDALKDVLESDNRKTRLGLSKAAAKAAQQLGKQDPDWLMTEVASKSAKNWAGTASIVHSWAEKEQQAGPLNLQMLGGRAVIQINQGQKPD